MCMRTGQIIILLEHLEHLPAKPDFGVHHVLLDIDGGKPFLARDTCDSIFRFLARVSDDNEDFETAIKAIYAIFVDTRI